MIDGLKDKYRKAIIDILAAHPGVERVVLFGSRAMGIFTTTSDVDIALFGDNLTLTDLAELSAQLEETPIPQQIDLLLHRNIESKELLEHIKRHGTVLYGPSFAKTGKSSAVTRKWKIARTNVLIAAGKLVINDGYRAKNSELSRNGIPFARAQNINGSFHFDGADCFPEENLGKVGIKISQTGDVVFTSKGTVGRFAYVRPETPRFVYAPQLCFWRSLDHDIIDPRWLSFWMNSREFYVQYKGVAGQTDMAEYVSLRDQRAMHITLPPITDQRAIAHILGSLDDKIELNRQMNRTLEKMGQAIFKSWFIDFDPVRAKLEGRDTGLPKEIADLFPNSFEDFALGEIPKGWEVRKLEDVCVELRRGISPKYTDGDGILVLNQRCVRDHRLIFSNARRHDSSKRSVKGRFLKPGDMLVNSTGVGTLGRVSFVASLPEPTIVDSHVTVLRFDETYYQKSVFCFSIIQIETEIKAMGEGSTGQTELSRKVLGAKSILVPGQDVQGHFESLILPIIKQMDANEKQSHTLTYVRDTLLPKLITGELHIPDAAKLMVEAKT